VARWPDIGPDSPIGRWIARTSRGRLTPRGVRLASFGVALAFGLVVVGLLFAMQVSSTPTFCGGVCHIMKPYYQSWKHSKHNQIACVDCHISPGITAELRKKYEALSMVVKYVTGTYGTNPWAEVDDAACLRCHERRLLEGKEVFHGVLFDHTPHLTETRRGLHLRCTSCHSQIVQGSHISVTSSTCALCHFKGRKLNQGSGRCLLCHQVPEKVTSVEGTTFDHGQVARLDMQCSLCHGAVVRGVGNVPRERCLTCHNQAERLAKLGDPGFLHRMHVTTHKVDCMNCHLQVEHGRPARPGAQLAAAAAACESCHGSGHSPQQDLYSGVGGRGVPRMPSVMFQAGVTCQGCHNPELAVLPAGAHRLVRGGAAGPPSGGLAEIDAATASSDLAGVHTARASAVSCMSCHGPGYQRIFDAWQAALASRTSALRAQLDATAGAMGLMPPAPWEDARHNYLLVDRGRGVHNVNFAFALLEKSHEQMNQARRAKGLAPLGRPWSGVSAGSQGCVACHVGIEGQRGTFGGRAFAHRPHVETAKLDCTGCHRTHAERAPGEVVRFGPGGCVACHHRAAEIDAQACMKCHGDVTGRTVTSFRGEFSHTPHLEQGLECASCHAGAGSGDPRPAKAVCAQCHTEG
jgi:nitrate/TMAO reductase-like tetraheme cytochrome c subunit